MSSNNKLPEDDNACHVELKLEPNLILCLSGTCDTTKYPQATQVYFQAAAPPDYRLSYSGSALPYPNRQMAYENSVNQGTVSIENGTFKFKVNYPNAYYETLGKFLIEPHVHLELLDKNNQVIVTQDVNINRLIGNRSLTSLYCKPNRSTRR